MTIGSDRRDFIRGFGALAAIAAAPKMVVYPVVDEAGVLLGTVRGSALSGALIDPLVAGNLLVFDLMKKIRGSVSPDDDLAGAMEKMEKFRFDFLPVVSEEGFYRGFIFRKEIFEQYRKLVREAQSF